MGRFRGNAGKWAFLYKYGIYRKIPARFCYAKLVNCPELGKEVSFETCLRCDKHQIWHPRDEIALCWYEYKELKDKGWYEPGDEYLRRTDPETFQRIQEKKRLYEEINREMNAGRTELDGKSEELMKEDSNHKDEFSEQSLKSFEQFFSEVNETQEQRESSLEDNQGENKETMITAVDIEPEDHQEDEENQEDEQTMGGEKNKEENTDEHEDEYEYDDY